MAGDRDFRKLKSSVQAELRRRAVALVDCGKTRQEAAAAVGVNRRFVGEWVKARDEGGDRALDGGKRGRRPGEQLALKDRDAAQIRRRIADKCPDQLKLPFALWTREAVAELIERETGIRLSRQAVSVYLKRWGFTAQRPMKRATERREPDIKQWLKTGYPALAKRAKAEKAEIQWADETGLANQANYGRSFAPRGKTPIIRRPAARFSQSMISSLTNRGKLRFMVYDGALNAGIFLRFLKRLVRGAQRKIFLSSTICAPSRQDRRSMGRSQLRQDRTRLPASLCARAQPRRVRQQRRQAGHGAPPSAQGQGRAQEGPHLLHARSAEAPGQNPRLLPGAHRALCCLICRRYIFEWRV